MANNLTKEKLKGLWARKEYIFKEEENQKIIKRFEFLEHLFDAIVNGNDISINENTGVATIGNVDIKNTKNQSPSISDFGPSNDELTEGGNGNSLTRLKEAFGDNYTYTYKDKDNKDKTRDWIKDIYCMMGGFDIDNPQIMHEEYRILGNGQKDSDEGTMTGRMAWPSYHFSNETYFFNVMKTIQNIKEDSSSIKKSRIVLRSKFSCFGEDFAFKEEENADDNSYESREEWINDTKDKAKKKDSNIADEQRKWLKTRFPYKFFYMWTHRDSCVHLLGLKAFQEICSDKKDEIKFSNNTNDFASFVSVINNSTDWKSYSESLLKAIGYENKSNDEKKKALHDLSLLLSIYFLQTPGILNMEELLKTGNQAIILWGPPGTGKTYHAKQLVCKLLGLNTDADIKNYRFNKDDDNTYKNGSYDIVQFHPNYTYEDFIGGIMPKCDESDSTNTQQCTSCVCRTKDNCPLTKNSSNGSSLSYEVVSGKFKEFCDKAKNYSNYDSKYNALLRICSLIKNLINYDFPDYITTDSNISGSGNIGTLISDFNNSIQTEESAVGNYSLKDLCRLLRDTNKAIDCYNEKKQPILVPITFKSKPFIFIIDEINRADLSAVFGELMYALEYRNEGVKIPHFKDPFVIPDNVYVIGTMNNVDKSLVSFDLALRRRFGFYKVMPQMVVLSDILSGKIGEDYIEPYITRCSELNRYISENANDNKHLGLGKDYQIGHAYFAKIEDFVYNRPDNHKIITTDDLEKLWVYHVMPLLEEYLGSRTEDEDIKKKLEAIYKEFTKTLV